MTDENKHSPEEDVSDSVDADVTTSPKKSFGNPKEKRVKSAAKDETPAPPAKEGKIMKGHGGSFIAVGSGKVIKA